MPQSIETLKQERQSSDRRQRTKSASAMTSRIARQVPGHDAQPGFKRRAGRRRRPLPQPPAVVCAQMLADEKERVTDGVGVALGFAGDLEQDGGVLAQELGPRGRLTRSETGEQFARVAHEAGC
jgi:hypothetical protein